ncbi:MAG: hypothetical protein CL671_08890 [Balneola sp.]|jgi:hypothetical protein|nr:hypothetical protein [Balneola sp.]MAO78767.1 hypothetical protein [Balneola sp.]MBF64718.1 hypothetical protein [Balneola sp.]HAW81351.1 hypothetical protein [Balneola sp.]
MLYSFKSLRLFFSCLIFIFLGCKYDSPVSSDLKSLEDIDIDLSSMYLIGGVYSSGFMDGALYSGGQEYSFMNLFSSHLDSVYGKGTFLQATIQSSKGLNLELRDESKGKFNLLYDSPNAIYPLRKAVSSGDEIKVWDGDVELLNDFSFPGLKVHQVLNNNGLSNNNYYSRLQNGNDSVIETVIDKRPSIIVLSLGNDDLLNFALNGATGDENPEINSIAENDLISANDFELILTNIIEKLINETNSNIFIVNVFDPLKSPFFNTINWALEWEVEQMGYDTTNISEAARHYEEFNQQIIQHNFYDNGSLPYSERRSIINFQLDAYCEGPVTPFCPDPYYLGQVNRARVIEDEYLDNDTLNNGNIIPKLRQLVEGEMVLYDNLPDLHSNSNLSTTIPLNDSQVLTNEEIKIIKSRLNEFNQIISDISNSNSRVNQIDFNRIMEQVKNEELYQDGVIYYNDFGLNSIYSSDGYSLNRRGHAFLTNLLIERINELFDENIPKINPNKFEGNKIEIGF